jgi:hypothetical protein
MVDHITKTGAHSVFDDNKPQSNIVECNKAVAREYLIPGRR